MKVNHEYICDVMSDMAGIILTFYNKIPKTTFLKIPGFIPDKDEGARTKEALNMLPKIAKEPAGYKTKEIAQYINNLFFYPKITDKKSLKKHEQVTKNLSISTAEARNNEKADLVLVIARHLHVAYAAFPKLKQIDEEKENKISKKFIIRALDGWDFSKDEKVDITKEVMKQLRKLDDKTNKKHYTKNEDYDDLASSETPEKWADKVNKNNVKAYKGKEK